MATISHAPSAIGDVGPHRQQAFLHTHSTGNIITLYGIISDGVDSADIGVISSMNVLETYWWSSSFANCLDKVRCKR